MAASGAAAASPDMSQYITRVEAQQEIGRLVKEQLETFQAQSDVIAEQRRKLEEQSREARDTSAKLALQVDTVLKQNKIDCDEQISQRVGELRAQAQDAVTTVQEKIKEMEALILAQTKAQDVSQMDADLSLTKHVADMVALEEKLRLYADGVQANLNSIQEEVVRTQAEIVRTQAGIRQLIESARNDGTSTLQRPQHERDRQVFDPRDYKIESLPSSISIGAWKKVEARGGDLRRHHRPELEGSLASTSTSSALFDGAPPNGSALLRGCPPRHGRQSPSGKQWRRPD